MKYIMNLNISKIQHFSVGDGAGIRTTVFCKGCNLRCPWCHNPETWFFQPQTLHYESLGINECCGIEMNVEDIVKDVLEDRDFYEESGGGVTISGGEALLQADGVAALAGCLKEEGIHVLIDTAGNVPFEAFERVWPYVDGFLYDFKCASEVGYQNVIKGNYRLIVENLRRLLAEGANVRIRIPLIPGFNTDPDSVAVMGSALQELGATEADLLPFHRMGSGKYKALGWEYPYGQVEPMTKEELMQVRDQYERYIHTCLE